MSHSNLEEQIAEVLDQQKFCSFGTVESVKPKVRYMALFNTGLNIHLATNRKTHKVKELENNPNVYILCGYEGNQPANLLEVEGTCEITKDVSLRKKVWSEELERWFTGPDDPDYVILDVTPTRIEFRNKKGDFQVWER